LKERFKNAEMVDKIRGYNLPLGSKKRKLSGDNYILIGDAASLIDPFTGEGIGNAMLSSMCALDIIVEGHHSKIYSADSLKQYDKAVYKRLGPELTLSRRMQQLGQYQWLLNFVVNKANRSKLFHESITHFFIYGCYSPIHKNFWMHLHLQF